MENAVYNINGKERSLREVLQNKYIIEYFQRDYTWERKQIEQLMYDLHYAFFDSYTQGDDIEKASGYKPYFMGPFIINKENSSYSLVDGQQRLTSLTLLVIYIMSICPELKDDLLSLVQRKHFGKVSYNLQIDDRKPIMDYLLGGDFPEVDLTNSNINLINRYNDIEELFSEELKEKDTLYVFANWLIEKIVFVEILSYSKDNAYTIFETMNDRGKNLTSTEMLKGFLLSKIKDDSVRQECNTKWSENISSLMAFDKDADADFFRSWLRGRYATGLVDGNSFEQIGTSFHLWVKTNFGKIFKFKNDCDLYNLIAIELPFYIDVYLTVRKAERQYIKGLDDIYAMTPYLFATSLFYPLYLSAVNVSDTKDDVIKKLGIVSHGLDRFISRRLIGRLSINQSSTRYSLYNLVENVRGKDIDDIANSMDNFVAKYANVLMAGDKISSYQYKTLKYILYRINLYLIRLQNQSVTISFNEISRDYIYLIGKDEPISLQLKNSNYRELGQNATLGLICFFNQKQLASFSNTFYNYIVKDDNKMPERITELLKKGKSIQEKAILLFSHVVNELW